nr:MULTISPECIES: lipid-binding SYLF domain-containing protein [unclassified Bombella]
MSLVFGGTGGACVLVGRGANNSWSDPAFYTLSAGSFGLQAGYQHSQLFLIITSKNAVLSMMDREYTFDASADAAFGSHGTSASNDHREVYALQKTNGVFAGVSLGSSKLKANNAANRDYYGQVVGAEDIVINMRVNNKAADPLRRSVMKAVSR